MSLACTTCNSEPVLPARSTAALAAKAASSEPSMASKIFAGKTLIYESPTSPLASFFLQCIRRKWLWLEHGSLICLVKVDQKHVGAGRGGVCQDGNLQAGQLPM